MITVHRPADDITSARPIEASLDELVVAYRTVDGERDSVPVDLPAIEDGDRWIGAAEIPAYLDELRPFIELWRRFQSDACYLEDDGSIC